MNETTMTRPTTKRTRKSAVATTPTNPAAGVPEASEQPDPRPQRIPTKASIVETLLEQDGGVSLDAMCQATGWLPHTCRAFLTGLRKKSMAIERSKNEDGTTIYKLTVAQDAA